MSEPGTGEILTREELDDLLAGPARERHGREDERLAKRLPRSRRAPPASSKADGELRLAVASCAQNWGRRMASSYQRRIECSLIGWEEIELADFAPAILDLDEAVCFSVSSETGFVLMARPLFTALLSLEFGAGGAAKAAVVPRRPYTGIERRLAGRLVRDLLGLLSESWRPRFGFEIQVAEVCGRERLLERASSRITLASFDVSALDVVGRIRIGLPSGPFREPVGPAPEAAAERGVGKLERGMVEVPLTLRAELGALDMTLAQLARLRVGDELEFQPSTTDGLLIRVEGKPKFRAIAGRLGNRLAAQAVERL